MTAQFSKLLKRFRKQSLLDRVVVSAFVIASVIYGGTKSPTNNPPPRMNAPRPVTQNDIANGDENFGVPSQGTVLTDNGSGNDEFPNIRSLTPDDYDAGVVFARIGTNETWNFSPPEGAQICEDWRKYGAAEDWFRTSFSNDWSFAFGTNRIDAMTVFSYGMARPKPRDATTYISPFRTSLGIVPAAKWDSLDERNVPSQYWQAFTSSNTFVMTWQNVLFNREPSTPVSFQAEFWREGRIVFRYDLSRLDADVVTSLIVGVSQNGSGRTFTKLLRDTTSLRWEWLDRSASAFDADEDGLSNGNEILVYGTDPYNADSDSDGLSDYEEVEVWHTDPLNAHSLSTIYCDGVAVKIGNEDPFSYPSGSTNTIMEHIFYAGTTNGFFAYPSATAAKAVLKVSCSGRGSGEVIIGDRVVALIGSSAGGGGGGEPDPGGGSSDDDDRNHGRDDEEHRPCCECHEEGSSIGYCSCGCVHCCRHGDGGSGGGGGGTGPGGPPPPPSPPPSPPPPLPDPLPPLCPQHHVYFAVCEPLHEEEFNRAERCDYLRDVLRIRNPPEHTTIKLVVPHASNSCCECPEHATNYVNVAYKDSKLEVLDERGIDFRISASSCDVKVAGIRPSSDVNDSILAFARNGQLYQEHSFTIFGVEITGENEDEKPLGLYNTLSPSLGFPFTVNTNLCDAPRLNLATHTGLPGGHIDVRLHNVTGKFKLWYYDYSSYEYRVLIDSSYGGSANYTFQEWQNLCNDFSMSFTRELPVFLTSSEAGSAQLVFRYWNEINGKFMYDVVYQNITSVNPPLLPDVNHDGQIDTNDVASCIGGKRFLFWNNEETIKGDYAGEVSDTSPNVSDLVVNGAYDLINFFPISLDLSKIVSEWGNEVTYTIKPTNPYDGMFNYCLAVIPKDSIANCQTTDARDVLGRSLKTAQLTSLKAEGNELSYVQVKALTDDDKVLFVEAAYPYQEIELVVSFAGVELYSCTAPIYIMNVRSLYCTVDLCGAVGGGYFTPAVPPEYRYRELEEASDGTHFIFAHGYNVNPSDAMIWHDQMYKRLWHSGSKSMYTGIIWHGCESQIQVPAVGGVTPDYYVNVINAFKTAPYLANVVNRLPGTRKYLAAHSLGNMLASSAIVDHGLSVNKYFMFNAAVAMEAYNPAAVTEESHVNMTPADWRAYDNRLRASHWHELFDSSDARNSLTWKGRFASIQNAVNYYSPEEDVLDNSDGETHFIASSDYAWANQELNKGVWPLYLPGNNEAGWGFNIAHKILIPGSGFASPQYALMPPSETTNLCDDPLKERPFFAPFDDMSICGTNLVTSIPNRAQLLADAIPAESYAAGRNPIPGWGIGQTSNMNINMMLLKNDVVSKKWAHSFLREASYFWIYKLFNDIVQRKE